MQKITLRKNEERRIKQGHLWIFSNEIEKRGDSDAEEIENGEIVDVYDYRDNYIGSGFYNGNSLIAVRMLTKDKEFDLIALFEKRVTEAYNFRKYVYPDRDSFRMVFSESDFLPGLIIDKYNNTFVLQIYSIGMEKNVELINAILKEKFNAQNIFTKNEEYFRILEGLSTENIAYAGEMNEEIISDGSVKYKINFSTAHKTGFYFDQCDNRVFAGKFCKNRTVLDCFCNVGGFGMHAAFNGAESVTFVDSSKDAVDQAKINYQLNEFSCSSEFINQDVFDYLERCIAEKKKYDIVIIDPPAFAKNKKSLPAAVKGYEKLNRLAMEVAKDGGIVFSSSCSHHLKQDVFINTIQNASIKVRKNIQLFHFNNASLDHPILPAMDETVYLKFAGIRIIG